VAVLGVFSNCSASSRLPGLFHGPLRVVVAPLVLVAAYDMPARERLDPIDRFAPWAEADDRALAEVHMNRVVDHVPGHDQP